MDFAFTKEQQELRKTIINFARNELNPGLAERDKTSTFSRDLWNKCAEMRLMALPFPETQCGDGFDMITTMAIYHALGYGCKDAGLILALASQLICGWTICMFASPEQASRLMPDLVSGKAIYCQGITEPGSGSDGFAMRTNADKKDDGYVINGTKTMISNGPVADCALIYAVTDPTKKTLSKISCFHVTKDTPGFSRGKPMEKMGNRTITNGELICTDCYVPASSMIGREGQGVMLFSEVVEWERVMVSACLLGTLERVLEGCVTYAKEREAFGKPISEFQAISHKIATMKVNAELGRLALYNAASLKQRRKGAALETSVAKLFISESLKQACLDAIQIRGGYGYMTEYEVERDLRDSIAATIYSGTSEMQLNTIARFAGL
jgi:alkylation response protein AidB-like acyl-CoA dehydrogenase